MGRGGGDTGRMLRKCAAGNPGCDRGGGWGGCWRPLRAGFGVPSAAPALHEHPLKLRGWEELWRRKPGPWEGPKRPPEPPLPPPAWILLPAPQNLPGGTFPVGSVTNRRSPHIAVSPSLIRAALAHICPSGTRGCSGPPHSTPHHHRGGLGQGGASSARQGGKRALERGAEWQKADFYPYLCSSDRRGLGTSLLRCDEEILERTKYEAVPLPPPPFPNFEKLFLSEPCLK